MQKKRKQALEEYVKLIQGAERAIGKKLPRFFYDLKGLMKDIDGLSDKEKLELCLSTIDEFNEFISKSQIEGGSLPGLCKQNITEIVDKTYKLTGGKGVQLAFWKYMEFILYIARVIDSFEKLKDGITEEMRAYFLLKIYGDVYELTLKCLLEFALVIADKTKHTVKPNSPTRRLLKKYNAGEDVQKRDIMALYRSQDLWRNCPVIDQALWRNKPVHAEAYYISDVKKIKIGELTVEFEDLEKRYREILAFNTEMINQIFIKGNIYNNLDYYKSLILRALKKLDK